MKLENSLYTNKRGQKRLKIDCATLLESLGYPNTPSQRAKCSRNNPDLISRPLKNLARKDTHHSVPNTYTFCNIL